MLGMIAFAVDIGYMNLARTQLQAAADSAALAAAGSSNLSKDDIVTSRPGICPVPSSRRAECATENGRRRVRRLGRDYTQLQPNRTTFRPPSW